MQQLLKIKLIGIPLLVWGLQLLYVAVMLGLYAALMHALKLNEHSTSTKLLMTIPYVIVVIIINIAWRVAIKNHLPNWF